MQGVDPSTNTLVKDPQARIVQAFRNLKLIAESAGASLRDCVRLTVYVSDLHRYAAMVDKAQAELWGGPPYPPRTMVEVQRLFDDDIVEVDSLFISQRRSSRICSLKKELDAGQAAPPRPLRKYQGSARFAHCGTDRSVIILVETRPKDGRNRQQSAIKPKGESHGRDRIRRAEAGQGKEAAR